MKNEETETAAGFNGWANRPTWNVALWLLNDEGHYIAMTEAFCGEKKIGRQAAKIWVSQRFPSGATPDGLPLSSVNWDEIAAAIEEAVNA